MHVLDNTGPCSFSSVVSLKRILAFSRPCNKPDLNNMWYTKQFQYWPIPGHSSIWDLKYTFLQIFKKNKVAKLYPSECGNIALTVTVKCSGFAKLSTRRNHCHMKSIPAKLNVFIAVT